MYSNKSNPIPETEISGNEKAHPSLSDGPPHLSGEKRADATQSRTILPRHAAGGGPQYPIRRLLTPSLAQAPSGPSLNLSCKTVRVNCSRPSSRASHLTAGTVAVQRLSCRVGRIRRGRLVGDFSQARGPAMSPWQTASRAPGLPACAQAALVGEPNAGKSSLPAATSAGHPASATIRSRGSVPQSHPLARPRPGLGSTWPHCNRLRWRAEMRAMSPPRQRSPTGRQPGLGASEGVRASALRSVQLELDVQRPRDGHGRLFIIGGQFTFDHHLLQVIFDRLDPLARPALEQLHQVQPVQG